MVLLPIVDRELRVAARKRSTYWLRMAAVLTGLLIGGGFLLLNAASGVGTARLGGPLFGILTWLAMAAAVSGGLFFTADALSEEKREGTLGFLFLTDLRGYDVAAGKLLATSLRGSYALLAFFPVLATTLLMGGVTGGHFWKTTLAIVNGLFCSLSTGLLVSATSRDAQRAMGGTLLALFCLFAGGPILDGLWALFHSGGVKPVLSLTSAVYVFGLAGAWGHPPYWRGLLVSWLCGWALLGAACWLTPRTWQERGRATAASIGPRGYARRYGGADRRAALRRKLIGLNPVLWLTCRERGQTTVLWLVTGAVLASFALVAWVGERIVWAVWSQCSWMVMLVLYLWVASQAGRFFVEARKGGLIELLLVAPLSAERMVQGQWGALKRLFGLPVVVLLVLHLASAVLARASTGVSVGGAGGPWPDRLFGTVLGCLGAVSTAANLVALGWVGMWMGLTSKNSSLATLKTLLFVQVIPYLAIAFVSGIISAAVAFGGSFFRGSGSMAVVFTFPIMMAGVNAALALLKDVCFINWARKKLYSSFHEQVVRSVGLTRFAPAPVVMLPPPLPARRPS